LSQAGIETSPAFSFTPAPKECSPPGEADGSNRNSPKRSPDHNAFCLGCHQYLTVLDLEHIVRTFDSIFDQYEQTGSGSSAEQHRRGDG
jgi:hypothetical protein